MTKIDEDNRNACDAWNANAQFWEERMADGNDFFKQLVWPAMVRLLAPQPGVRLLDVACGNGLTSLRLAEMGADVLAIDFSERLIELARVRRGHPKIDYRVVDATNYDELKALGQSAFDSALCNMALMDVANLQPLMKALSILLRPNGHFVFSVVHPCFNNPSTVQMAEVEDRDGVLETVYSVKTKKYLTSFTRFGAAMHEQPVPHPYFHRPLSVLIGAGLDEGFVLDGLEERAFPTGVDSGTTPLSWSGRFSEIPPVLVGRMRQLSRAQTI